jgi:uncharacterized protein (UPF0128 family)
VSTIGLCRATGTHAWAIVGPITITKDDRRRVTLRFGRCEAWRFDMWHPKHGGIEGRAYQLTEAYRDYLKDHKRDGARLDVMSSMKEVKEDERHNARVRLLHGGRASRHKSKVGRRQAASRRSAG